MKFNGERLRVLRRFHYYTQRDLGDKVGATASTITKYERGNGEPKEMALNALCVVLGVRPLFFFDPEGLDEFRDPQTYFRSRVTTTTRLREKILAHATLFGALMDYMATTVKWPPLRLPKVSVTTPAEIEDAAERFRLDIGVGIDAPIESVVHLAELAGIVITALDTAVSSKIDAFSRYGATNMIVLNPSRDSIARTRFDVAHEIAHGMLHRDESSVVHAKVKEQQAEYFAGALLMPRTVFSREFWSLGLSPTWAQLIGLKERWGAHLPAIIVRAYQLNLIDAAEYQRRFKYMAKAGWLRPGGVEPGEPTREMPQLFGLGLSRFLSETGKDATVMADDLYWTPELFKAIAGVEPPIREAPNVTSFEAFRQRKMAAG